MEVLAISSAGRSLFTRIFGSHPSVTNSPVKGSSIIALTNLPSVINNGETVGHLPRKFSKIAWYRFDLILLFWG